jgi:DNA-binding MarR family transcriptional regulator
MGLFYTKRNLVDLVRDLLPSDLTKAELDVLEYFLRNISVGEIIAVRELRLLYKIDDPGPILEKLIQKNLIERGEGCFNLSKNLIEALKKRK